MVENIKGSKALKNWIWACPSYGSELVQNAQEFFSFAFDQICRIKGKIFGCIRTIGFHCKYKSILIEVDVYCVNVTDLLTEPAE